MMRNPPPQPAHARPSSPQLDLELDPTIEALIEARAASLAQHQALFWRFRLVTIETLMMGALILCAGLALHQPAAMVLRAAIMVSAGCFASGMLLIGLTGAFDRGLDHFTRWRRGQ
ncbi:MULTISPECIES: hypothetical protein [Sphingobium]|uniref:hypothetical protein n=1 Tax=Sphingobium TaxID=165695 RepID=UPI000671F1BB|nr:MULTISPECIES: hypothetical protein [Sphingobium]KMW29769.1 hypothetical protein BV87_11310 [Sphingobium yanoikuyae]